MKATTRRLIGSWLGGAAIGTAIIAATSPLFVRSYLPLQVDPVRGAWTMPSHSVYRWRSEGYADTHVGPLGMPGKTTLEGPETESIRVALWGDSQAEGVCVSDRDKIFAQTEHESDSRLQVLPLAFSGEDAADWLTQIPAVESDLAIDMHVLFVVDLVDLLSAPEAPLPPPTDAEIAAGQHSVANWAPAFVIQTARYLLREEDGATPRHLRFRLGPVRSSDASNIAPDVGQQSTAPESMSAAASSAARLKKWREAVAAIRRTTSLPIVIFYAPVSPQIVGGRIVIADESSPDSDFQLMRQAAEQSGVIVVSAGKRLIESADRGQWPHGFQNGQIGSGHLNRTGNGVVAAMLAETILPYFDRSAVTASPTETQQSREGD